MAQNIATLAVKFIADTLGLKKGAAEVANIVQKPVANGSLAAFKNWTLPKVPDSLKAFQSFFQPKGESPFGKVPSLFSKIGDAAKSAIGGTGQLQSLLVGLGPAGVFAGGAVVAALALVAGGIFAAHKALDQFSASAARIDATSKLATRLDLTYASLQKLTFLAGDAPGGVESLAKAMEHMARQGLEDQKALAGTGDAAKSLADSVATSSGTIEERFAKQAQRISAIKDPILRSAEATRVFGKEGAALLPLLKDIADNSARFDRFGKSFGFKINEADSKNIERMRTAMGDLGFIAVQLADKFVSKFGGPVAAFFENVIKITEGWATTLGNLGVTWDGVGGFAVSLMNIINMDLALANALVQGWSAELMYVVAAYKDIEGFVTRDVAMQEQARKIRRQADEDLKSSGKTIADFFSGALSRKFKDQITNGTDFSKRGGSFGFDAAAGPSAPDFPKALERGSAEAASAVLQAGGNPIGTVAENTKKMLESLDLIYTTLRNGKVTEQVLTLAPAGAK